MIRQATGRWRRWQTPSACHARRFPRASRNSSANRPCTTPCGGKCSRRSRDCGRRIHRWRHWQMPLDTTLKPPLAGHSSGSWGFRPGRRDAPSEIAPTGSRLRCTPPQTLRLTKGAQNSARGLILSDSRLSSRSTSCARFPLDSVKIVSLYYRKRVGRHPSTPEERRRFREGEHILGRGT